MNKSYLIIGCLLFLTVLSGCGKPKTPSDTEVRDLISSKIPASAPWKIGSVTTEKLPTGEGLATVKFKVVLVLDQDLYTGANLAESFRSQGLEVPDWAGLTSRAKLLEEPDRSALGQKPGGEQPSKQLVQRSEEKGKEFPAYGTFEAKRLVDTWSLQAFIWEKEPVIKGRPLRDDDSQLVVGSDAFKSWSEQEVAKAKEYADKVAEAETRQQVKKAEMDRVEAEKNAEMAKVKEQERQKFIDAYTTACAPGTVWVGRWKTNNYNGKLAIRFVELSQGGKILKAEVYDPDIPGQKRELTGQIIGFGENNQNQPIRLTSSGDLKAERIPTNLYGTTLASFLDLRHSYTIGLCISGEGLEGKVTSDSVTTSKDAQIILDKDQTGQKP